MLRYGIGAGRYEPPPIRRSDREAVFDQIRQMPVELPPWLEGLRRSEIVERVRNDPRSVGGTVLGEE